MPDLDLLATGYPSLDHIIPSSRCAGPGETALISRVIDEEEATPGGCGANVAMGLQKLGLSTGVALVLGDDSGGHAYRAALDQAGVDTRHVTLLHGERSARTYLFCAPDGDVQTFYYPGAADAWRGDLKLTGLESVRMALVTVNFLPYNQQFVAQCAAAGVSIAWQLKPDVAAYPPHAAAAFAKASRLIFCNQREAQGLLQALGLTDAHALLDAEVEAVITTLGGDGAHVMTAAGEWHIPAVPVSVVDTTGAGDAFTAGYLAGYLDGLPAEECGRMGVVAASFVVEALGCQTQLASREQLNSRLREVFR